MVLKNERRQDVPDTQTSESSEQVLPKLNKLQSQTRQISWQQKLQQIPRNLSIRAQLSILLVLGSAMPVILVTQGLVWFSQQNAHKRLEELIRSHSEGFAEDYVQWNRGETVWQASALAETIEAAKINLQNPYQARQNRPFLQALVSRTYLLQDQQRADAYKSFRIITDAEGETVAQFIQIQKNYPVGETPTSSQALKPVSLPTGIYLRDVPIIRNALQTGRSLSGIELLDGKFIQRLGLEKQATVKVKPQAARGLKPFDLAGSDQGRAGMVAMAVQPIKVEGKVTGVVVVGLLLNQCHTMLDMFGTVYDSAAAIYAQNLRVATTIPEQDGKTRALGVKANSQVTQAVLNKGQLFFGQEIIQGKKYLTAYAPLFDHRQELNPNQAKPVGMAFVGVTSANEEVPVAKLQFIGYSMILLVVVLLAIPLASAFSRPIRRLSSFAQRLGAGEQGVRLEATQRGDEIGVLSQELNKMADSIESNLQAARRQEELRRRDAQQQRQEKEALQQQAMVLISEVEPVIQGDLTVQAQVSADEIGIIANSYNAIISSLRRIVAQVQFSAGDVSQTAVDNETAVSSLSAEAMRQVEAINTALRQIQAMADSSQVVAANAQQAEHKVQQAAETVQAGDVAMNRTVEGFMAIQETVAQTAKKVKRLGEASQKISKVVNLISDFAAQTNLLALKAAIEAAHAKSEGQGFAVVAEGVRSLAQQSTAATGKIERLVEEIQKETQEVVVAMEAGMEQVVTGTQLVEETRARLNQITATSNQINALVEEISQAAAEHVQSCICVTQTMQEATAIANQTSEKSIVVADSFSKLLKVAQDLGVSVAQFKVK